MAKVTYDKQLTALLVIDPYNDFISEGGDSSTGKHATNHFHETQHPVMRAIPPAAWTWCSERFKRSYETKDLPWRWL